MTSSNLALPGWLDPATLINGMGSWAVAGILLIIFAECGLLIGFFLPGDTLLFLSGVLIAARGAGEQGLAIDLWVFVALLAVAAFAGNMVGYAIGRKIGPAVFSRPDARFLKKQHVYRSAAFFNRYGRIAVVLARFVPVVRTVATVMAGVSRMNTKVYALYSAIGGALWVTLVTVAGYYLGQIQFVKNHIDLILLAAVIVVILGLMLPAIAHLRQRRTTVRNRADSPSDLTWPDGHPSVPAEDFGLTWTQGTHDLDRTFQLMRLSPNRFIDA